MNDYNTPSELTEQLERLTKILDAFVERYYRPYEGPLYEGATVRVNDNRWLSTPSAQHPYQNQGPHPDGGRIGHIIEIEIDMVEDNDRAYHEVLRSVKVRFLDGEEKYMRSDDLEVIDDQ